MHIGVRATKKQQSSSARGAVGSEIPSTRHPPLIDTASLGDGFEYNVYDVEQLVTAVRQIVFCGHLIGGWPFPCY